MWLATYLKEWMERGYSILVTGDHGINANGRHGGTTPDVREVPLFFIRPGLAGMGDTRDAVSQLQIAPTMCKLLGLEIPKMMKAVPLAYAKK